MESVWTEVDFREVSTRDEDPFFFDAVIALSVGPISLLVVVLFVKISKEGSIMRDIEDVDIEDLTEDVVVFILLDEDGEVLVLLTKVLLSDGLVDLEISVTGEVVGITGKLEVVSRVTSDDFVVVFFEEDSVTNVFEESRPMATLELDSDSD